MTRLMASEEPLYKKYFDCWISFSLRSSIMLIFLNLDNLKLFV